MIAVCQVRQLVPGSEHVSFPVPDVELADAAAPRREGHRAGRGRAVMGRCCDRGGERSNSGTRGISSSGRLTGEHAISGPNRSTTRRTSSRATPSCTRGSPGTDGNASTNEQGAARNVRELVPDRQAGDGAGRPVQIRGRCAARIGADWPTLSRAPDATKDRRHTRRRCQLQVHNHAPPARGPGRIREAG